MSKKERLRQIRARPKTGWEDWKEIHLKSSTVVRGVDIAWDFLSIVAKDLRVDPTQIQGDDKYRADLFPNSFWDGLDQPDWITIGEMVTDVLWKKLPDVDWSSVRVELDTTVRDVITQMVSAAQKHYAATS